MRNVQITQADMQELLKNPVVLAQAQIISLARECATLELQVERLMAELVMLRGSNGKQGEAIPETAALPKE